jgi:NADPH:quinone reductase-like Zn-dependent oxidoreductase
VRGWRVGDRAMALLAGGGYAEQVVVHAGSLLPVPAHFSWEQAASLPEVYLTVFLTVFQLGGLAEGDTVLVHGGGSGIGTALHAARELAGARVVATAGLGREVPALPRARRRRGRELPKWRLRRGTQQATGGRGADVVLDSIGAALPRSQI